MGRKWIVLMVCLAIVVCAIPVQPLAAEDKAGQLCRQITEDYKKALSGSGKESLHGYCGLMSSWQLYLMGINEKLIVRDGKDQYDAYCGLETTTGGYLVKAFPAEDYTLEEALNVISENGTKDVFNLLVGFHRTTTAAGARYGHALVINGILDGVVYFTEGFPTPFCAEAGGVNACTIQEFAADYDSWAAFEGVIYFCGEDYIDHCTVYPSHLFVQGGQPMQVYSQPCIPGTSEFASAVLRSAVAGERFLVTGVIENHRGEYFYRINDSGSLGYISAENTAVLRFNSEDARLTDMQLPAGKDGTVSGRIVSQYIFVEEVCLELQDAMGQAICSEKKVKKSGIYDVKWDTFHTLEEGYYTYLILGACRNYYLQEGLLQSRTDTVTLLRWEFPVGDLPVRAQAASYPMERREGWTYERGTWYYYEAGAPRAGWFCYQGTDYYLKEDGSVTTGWATVNGKARFFSDTGAMRTGWIKTEQGIQYLLSNGVAACGWRTVDGVGYFFDKNGLLQTSLQQTVY